MIIKRDMALASLTKVCEESLALIKQLIDVDNATYAQGYEDGVAAQAKVQQTLKPWVGLTDEEVELYWDWEDFQTGAGRSTIFKMVRAIEAKLKEKNT
jgi:hypothetical protein